MTRFKYTLGALILAIGSVSLGEDSYDEWTCRERDMLKGVGLQCISCGIQQYYSEKGQAEVVPSEKWLAFLAVNARAFRQLSTGRPAPRTSGYGSQETDNLKMVMIKQIQAYGFCSRFISRDTMKVTGGKNYRDLSSEDWKFLKPLITSERNDTEVNNAAKFFGFKQPTFLGMETGGKVALQNMRELMDDSHLNEFSTVNKRGDFKDKLKKVLSPEYNISGEKTNNEQVLASEDKDQGLRKCLEDVQQRLKSPEYSDTNIGMCKSMATACGMQTDFCGEPRAASGVRTAPENRVSPNPPDRKNSPLPPPPGPGGRFDGVQ